MKKLKCEVCGKRFEPASDKKYNVLKQPVGLQAIVERPVIYEAFDCPKCGCQKLVGVREIRHITDEDWKKYFDECDKIIEESEE